MIQIIPAILSDNIFEIQGKLEQLHGLSEWVQFDVCDGTFVKNRTVAVADLANIQTKARKEVHLMVEDPLKYLDECQSIGAERVYVHVEALKDRHNFAQLISYSNQRSMTIGVAINPDTDFDVLGPCLRVVHHVLVMGVQPGWQGATFIPKVLTTVKKLAELAPRITIGIDGGIKLGNIQSVAQAGAENIYVGSALFKNDNPAKAIKKFKTKIACF